MQSHDIAHQDQRRRPGLFPAGDVSHGGQGTREHPLLIGAGPLHQGDWGLGRPAVVLQLLTDDGQAHQTHVEHQGFRVRLQLAPVVIQGVRRP